VRNQAAMFIWCVPLAIHCVLQSLVENVPRYFIEAHNGTRVLGMFSAIAALISAGGTVVSALGQSAYPRLALLNARDAKGAFDRLLIRLMLVAGTIGALGVLAAALFGREILTLLYKAQYTAFAPEFVWLMVAGGIGYVAQFPGYALSACGRFALQVPLIGSVAVTAMVASFYIVPRYSLRGAAMALALAAIVQLAGGLAGLKYAPAGGREQRVGCPR
jgi:O-antigen/teichoic acid export membrane protein